MQSGAISEDPLMCVLAFSSAAISSRTAHAGIGNTVWPRYEAVQDPIHSKAAKCSE